MHETITCPGTSCNATVRAGLRGYENMDGTLHTCQPSTAATKLAERIVSANQLTEQLLNAAEKDIAAKMAEDFITGGIYAHKDDLSDPASFETEYLITRQANGWLQYPDTFWPDGYDWMDTEWLSSLRLVAMPDEK